MGGPQAMLNVSRQGKEKEGENEEQIPRSYSFKGCSNPGRMDTANPPTVIYEANAFSTHCRD